MQEMKAKRRKSAAIGIKKMLLQRSTDDVSEDLQILKKAWSSLPADMTEDERFIFFEIAEKVVKFYKRMKSSNIDEDFAAN